VTVSAASLPKDSALWAHHAPGDFMDCYEATAVSTTMELEDAVRTAIAEMPAWVSLLMDMRNRIVGPLGLKAGRHSLQPESATGDEVALETPRDPAAERIVFTVRERYEHEIILGEDDKHLDFRVTLYREHGTYYVATWVRPNAWYGWVYLYSILPFHKLIMRLSAKRLEKTS